MSEEDKKLHMNRRDFLKAAGVGMGAGLLTGCTPKIAATSVPTTEATQLASSKHSWEIVPDPIPDSKIAKTIETDIVVIGAGIAGQVAALSAAEAGAKVIVIEKTETYSSRGLDNAAINSRLHKKLGIEIDKKQAVRELIRNNANRVKEELHWLFVNHSGEAMDWLMDMTEAEGLTTYLWDGQYKGPDYHEYPVTHRFMAPKDAPEVPWLNQRVSDTLVKNAKGKGVDFEFNIKAEQLLRPSGGRVTGVVASTSDGTYVKYLASKAVILCTGDYGSNDEMVDYFCPDARYGEVNWYIPQGANQGDGHRMGMWIGAKMQKGKHAPMIHMVLGASNYFYLHVNKFGLRYENEDKSSQALGIMKAMQPDNIGWVVYDDKYLEEIPTTIAIGGGFGWDQNRLVGDKWDPEVEKASHKSQVERGVLFEADTLDELAGKMGVPADSLKATVERYNKIAEAKDDSDFGKRPELLFPINKPPFYAGKLVNGLLVVAAGFSVNTNMQVLDPNDQPIPGLYAAGNVAGDFYSVDYPTVFPGHSHGRCLTFGRIAGAHAAGKPLY
jgi:hypothetical protein